MIKYKEMSFEVISKDFSCHSATIEDLKNNRYCFF